MRAAEVPSQNGRLVRPFDVGLKLDNKKTWHFRAAVERLGLLICPSGGLSTGLSSLISDIPKNIFVPTRPNQIYNSRIPPHQRGVSRSSRTRGGVRWTRQHFARDGIAGRASACERLPSERTRDVAAYGEVVWS